MEKSKGAKDRSNKLSITADCYIDENGYQLFLDILQAESTIHGFSVSYFHAIELGLIRVKNLLQQLGYVQVSNLGS